MLVRLPMVFLGAGLTVTLSSGLVLAQHGDCRTGCPNCVACWARPSNTKHYIGYYVGGGLPCGGEGRFVEDGTWGWDYQGCFPRRIALLWSHGRHCQGGVGAYKTDGPHVPDLPAYLNPSLYHHKEEKKE